jgi:hypothetical protein
MVQLMARSIAFVGAALYAISLGGCIPASMPTSHKRICVSSQEIFLGDLKRYARKRGMIFLSDTHENGVWIVQISSFRSEVIATYIPEVNQVSIGAYNKAFIPRSAYNSTPVLEELLRDEQVAGSIRPCPKQVHS